MERSGWFDDDDDESTSSPPPEARVWRHPSELGAHGVFGAPPPRRRHGLRFAGAVALGSAGTIAFAVLTSMHLFGADFGRVASPFDTADVTLLTVPLRPLTTATTPGTVPEVEPVAATTAAVATPSSVVRPGANMPPRVGLRVAGATPTVPAVVDDDGYVLTGTEDLAGATEAQVVLDDGTEVTATVDSVDEASGVTRLRPSTPVRPPAEQTTAWLGVSCADDTVPENGPAAPAEPAPATTAAVNSSTSLLVATSTTAGPVPVSSTAGPSTSADARATPTAATTTTVTTAGSARTATPSAVTTTATPSAVTTTAAPSGPTSDGRPRLVSTSAPAPTTAPSADPSGPEGTTADPTAPTAPPTTTAASRAGVRVHLVHADSPAAASGVRRGDMIMAVDGRPVHSRWALVLAVRRHAIGDTVTLELVRDDVRMRIEVVLAAGPTA